MHVVGNADETGLSNPPDRNNSADVSGAGISQAPRSLSPAVATIEPIFPSWEARGDLWGYRPSSVAFPRLRWSTDIAISAAGLTGYTISRSFAITRQTVPQQGLDRSTISWGLDRNIIGNPSTSADKASDVTLVVTMVGAPVLALLTQPGVHGFENVVRRPLVLYGESLLLAEAGTRLLKRSADRPRPFTYLPESERPGRSRVQCQRRWRLFVDAFRACNHQLYRGLVCGRGQPAVPSFRRVAGARRRCLDRRSPGRRHRQPADQGRPAFPFGCAGWRSNWNGQRSVQSYPSFIAMYSLMAGRPRVPRGHAWLETTAGYLLGVGVGVGLSSLAY